MARNEDRNRANPEGLEAQRLGRRAFLRAAAASGLLLPSGVRAHDLRTYSGSGRQLVFINLQGGYDALSMLHPYGDGDPAVTVQSPLYDRYRSKRPVLAWETGRDPTLPVTGHPDLRWHPACELLRREFSRGDLAVVQKIGLPVTQLSHFKAKEIMALGRADLNVNPDKRGWLGRLADAGLSNPYDVLGIGVNPSEVFRAAGDDPLVMNTLSSYSEEVFGRIPDHDMRRDILRRIAAQVRPGEPRLSTEVKAKVAPAMDGARDLANATSGINLTGNYPDRDVETLGRSLQDIARLIGSNLGTRVYYSTSYDFDTHGGQEGEGEAFERPTLTERLSLVFDAIDAFITDLKSPAINAWGRTMIVLYTEFGRRNAENQTRGTDHGRGFHAFVLGGQVAGGLKGNPLQTADIDADNLPVEIDFRTLHRKTLSDWLQLPTSVVSSVFDDYLPLPNEPSFNIV